MFKNTVIFFHLHYSLAKISIQRSMIISQAQIWKMALLVAQTICVKVLEINYFPNFLLCVKYR